MGLLRRYSEYSDTGSLRQAKNLEEKDKYVIKAI